MMRYLIYGAIFITLFNSLSYSSDIDNIIKKMSIEEKVGQLFMVALVGKEVTKDIENIIKNYHIGGVILFYRNVDNPIQVAKLCDKLQKLSKIPLLISIDQEGGPNSQLYDVNGFTSTVSNMAIGAISDEIAAYNHAKINAQELKAVGINMNLAPVVDVNNNPDNPIINIRSYSEDPDKVAKLAQAAIKGYQENGIIATAKHFPGHGDTTIDSHIDLPRIDHPLERLERIELKPFVAAIEAGVGAIMTAHILYPQLDPTLLPATLSKEILTNFLRKKLNFDGIIITDSMEMRAIADNYGEIEATTLAILAGADIILVCNPFYSVQKRRIETIIDKVKKGEILQERIDSSVRRILRIKEKFNIFNYKIDIESVTNKVRTKENLQEALDEARRSVTVIKNQNNLIPLKLKGQKLLVISPSKININPSTSSPMRLTNTVGEELKKEYNNVEEILIDTNPTPQQINECVDRAQYADIIIITTINAHFSKKQIELIEKLKEKKLIVVAAAMPYDLIDLPFVNTFIATYGYRDCSIKAAAEVILGKVEPKGKLPVRLK